jgi:hypothetical protein
VVVCAVVGLVTPASVAHAAPEAGSAPVRVVSATLGHICDGTFGNIAKFVIISDGGIPAGSTWTVNTSNVDWADFVATPDSPLIQTTRLSKYAVSLKALVALPAGTVVKVTPSYFYVDQTGTTVTISGYGGSDSMYFTLNGGPC